MADVKVFVTRDSAEFAKRTRDFLTRRPIEHNVLATVVATFEPNDCIDPPLFAWAEASGGGEVWGRCYARRLGACWPPASAWKSPMR